jgi:putative nucleotidyltransferase with HDIG domain
MLNIIEDSNLLNVEKRTIKWFVALFYIISILFDFVYDYIIPKLVPQVKDDSPNLSLLGYWIYIFLFGLIPFAIYLYKKGKVTHIKYLYFICYISINLINDCVSYFNHPKDYNNGNAVELLWLLLSPIFVSFRFVNVVTLGLIIKYILVGWVIQSPNVFVPVLLMAILSIFSYIFLNRIQSYVKAIKTSHDQQLVGIVKGVIATLELKDPYTRGHSERVANYALLLAQETGKYSEEELRAFNYACLLHDIGKINIPDKILMKPTSLTKEEYEIIKSHTIVGAEAVSKVVGFQNSISVIRSHHERWDGKGYPDHLEGTDIPFLARVAAVADAFDAMTSNRSYRSALTVKEAAKRILEGKGTQFDPELVDIFEIVLPKWNLIHKEWNEKQSLEAQQLNERILSLKEVES